MHQGRALHTMTISEYLEHILFQESGFRSLCLRPETPLAWRTPEGIRRSCNLPLCKSNGFPWNVLLAIATTIKPKNKHKYNVRQDNIEDRQARPC